MQLLRVLLRILLAVTGMLVMCKKIGAEVNIPAKCPVEEEMTCPADVGKPLPKEASPVFYVRQAPDSALDPTRNPWTTVKPSHTTPAKPMDRNYFLQIGSDDVDTSTMCPAEAETTCPATSFGSTVPLVPDSALDPTRNPWSTVKPSYATPAKPMDKNYFLPIGSDAVNTSTMCPAEAETTCPATSFGFTVPQVPDSALDPTRNPWSTVKPSHATLSCPAKPKDKNYFLQMFKPPMC